MIQQRILEKDYVKKKVRDRQVFSRGGALKLLLIPSSRKMKGRKHAKKLLCFSTIMLYHLM